MYTDLTVADLPIRVFTPRDIPVNQRFIPFLGKNGMLQWTVCIQEMETLPSCTGVLLHTNEEFSVYRTEKGYTRVYPGDPSAFGVAAQSHCCWNDKRVTVCYRSQNQLSFADMDKCFSYVGFEELLMASDRMILHAAALDTPWGGILFSGPSAVGKSTQANLWCQHENGKLVNGDRSVLCLAEDVWRAYGSPYAGSSQCYVNTSVPIRAIVLLEQGNSCTIRSVAPAEAFAKLYAQTVVNAWNPVFVDKVCDLITDLVSRVPVYHLCCTPTLEAVRLLKATLGEGST